MNKSAPAAFILVLTLGCLIPSVGIADMPSSDNPSAHQHQQRSVGMKKHKGFFSERCLQFAADTRVEYQFFSPELVNFNVHIHTAEATIYPVKLEALLQHEGILEIDTAREYCFMWKSLSEAATQWELLFDYSVQRSR